ncbi:hypothetical protein EVAR_17444_1 [Eumeta japonica]|uniref:Uncharacterized protein n=1 Tax=Eumeta variegata TaxID=151549 RepID=A0A4C1VB75_EUMVA|nr:hypothetical protein EVAR_17444_1 [Eumeta japonica]
MCTIKVLNVCCYAITVERRRFMLGEVTFERCFGGARSGLAVLHPRGRARRRGGRGCHRFSAPSIEDRRARGGSAARGEGIDPDLPQRRSHAKVKPKSR